MPRHRNAGIQERRDGRAVQIDGNETEERVDQLSLCSLRSAIRANRVSFPSQVPIFSKHDRPDLQRQMVQLYFVLGWNCDAIGDRYGLIRQRVQQILNTWKRRAAQTGYLQQIPAAEEPTANGYHGD
jgi:hypothetical protein